MKYMTFIFAAFSSALTVAAQGVVFKGNLPVPEGVTPSWHRCLTLMDVQELNEINPEDQITYIPCQDGGQCRQFDTTKKVCFPPVAPALMPCAEQENPGTEVWRGGNFPISGQPILYGQSYKPEVTIIGQGSGRDESEEESDIGSSEERPIPRNQIIYITNGGDDETYQSPGQVTYENEPVDVGFDMMPAPQLGGTFRSEGRTMKKHRKHAVKSSPFEIEMGESKLPLEQSGAWIYPHEDGPLVLKSRKPKSKPRITVSTDSMFSSV